ncbi:MAG: serine/threonine-protein kinase [Sandaracinaceae bacterium]
MPILLPRERIGTLVGDRYRLESIIGSGGMGAIFAGRHTWTERPVAVKILHPEVERADAAVRRFFREAKSAARLSHPNVVQILDMGETPDGVPFLVLELLEGEPLSDRVERGALDPDEALRAMLPVMDGLRRAHELGIVHRDIKPENIFLSVDGAGRAVPKLLDFGITKLLDPQDSFTTDTGVVVGTPFYMSPEQAMTPERVDGQTDVWAVGVVLYELLRGDVPFDADLPFRLLRMVVAEEPLPLAEAAPWVPAPIAAAVHVALAKAPSARHVGMGAFMDALLEAAKESGVEAVDPRGGG